MTTGPTQRLVRFLGALILASLAGFALAQSSSATKQVGQSATLNWSAPTAYTSGAAITSGTAITYNVYSSTQAAGTTCPSGALSTPTQAVSGVATLSWATPAYTTAGVDCYAVTAVIAGVESTPSNTVQVNVIEPTPNPPGTLTVQ